MASKMRLTRTDTRFRAGPAPNAPFRPRPAVAADPARASPPPSGGAVAEAWIELALDHRVDGAELFGGEIIAVAADLAAPHLERIGVALVARFHPLSAAAHAFLAGLALFHVLVIGIVAGGLDVVGAALGAGEGHDPAQHRGGVGAQILVADEQNVVAEGGHRAGPGVERRDDPGNAAIGV